MRKLITAALLLSFSVLCGAAQSTMPPVSEAPENNYQAVVVLDPGHGGGEWGASAGSIHEKNINLKIALMVKKKLEASGKPLDVKITRTDDSYLSVQDRVGMANSSKADLFVCIHSDNLPQEKIKGYAVYRFYSPFPAQENPELVVKWDDVQKKHMAQSAKAAEVIAKYLSASLISESKNAGQSGNDTIPLDSRGVRKARSYCLNGADMPAVLIETANINNKEDASALKDDKILNSIAYHIKEGILAYLKVK
ncbi:MAG: N-acetylmuramoyl-L-alanine amidase [Candidatus Goldbacteria bacterium]|nr:N-acetylmuramoyl-L-alanine amidase [Candidatus Goldiibacteriota bacterium]